MNSTLFYERVIYWVKYSRTVLQGSSHCSPIKLLGHAQYWKGPFRTHVAPFLHRGSHIAVNMHIKVLQ